MNAFDNPHQFDTWRSVVILEDANNLIEVGWYREEATDNQAHPYKTRKENGVVTIWENDTLDITPTNAFHEFKVHDANNDNLWSFAYDGNPLGDEFSSVNLGTPVTESERRCTNDSLFAHFKNLKHLKVVGGSWSQYLSLVQYIDSATRLPLLPDFHDRIQSEGDLLRRGEG